MRVWAPRSAHIPACKVQIGQSEALQGKQRVHGRCGPQHRLEKGDGRAAALPGSRQVIHREGDTERASLGLIALSK